MVHTHALPHARLLSCAGVGYSLSGLVAQMREQDNQWQQGEVTVKLAKAYGYCWGVERAVRMAYEARNANPDKKLYITNEIIHNPEVNQVRVGSSGSSGGISRRGGCLAQEVLQQQADLQGQQRSSSRRITVAALAGAGSDILLLLWLACTPGHSCNKAAKLLLQRGDLAAHCLDQHRLCLPFSSPHGTLHVQHFCHHSVCVS